MTPTCVSFGRSRDVLLYLARADARKSSQVTVVEDQSLSELLAGADDPDWLEVAPIETFVSSAGQRDAAKLAFPAMWIDPSMRREWITPSGHYAILLAPAVDAPAHWAAYEVPTTNASVSRHSGFVAIRPRSISGIGCGTCL